MLEPILFERYPEGAAIPMDVSEAGIGAAVRTMSQLFKEHVDKAPLYEPWSSVIRDVVGGAGPEWRRQRTVYCCTETRRVARSFFHADRGLYSRLSDLVGVDAGSALRTLESVDGDAHRAIGCDECALLPMCGTYRSVEVDALIRSGARRRAAALASLTCAVRATVMDALLK